MLKVMIPILLCFAGMQYCTSDKTIVVQNNDEGKCPVPKSDNYIPSPVVNEGLNKPFDCSLCNYIVPENKYTIDGEILGLKPGDFVCLKASFKYGPLRFINIKGVLEKPITIVNCGGLVAIEVASDSRLVMRTENSQYFRITSVGNANSQYGIKLSGLSGSSGNGLTLDNLSSNFEIDHLEIFNTGFAGIMAKTDPSCNDASVRGNFTMTDIILHDNYIHDTGGEGFYLGNTHYDKGVTRDCGIRLPHEIHNAKVFNNIIKNPGWDGIQLGCATIGAEIYDNVIENYGAKNITNQRDGIQIGGGTGGLCYNNKIINGNGNAVSIFGIGDNIIFNNLIVNAGSLGIFCDDPAPTCEGFKILNNTIVNPKSDGIRIYAEKVRMNIIANNIIINPGSLADYSSLLFQNKDAAYVHKLDDVKVEMTNNYFAENINELNFIDPTKNDFSLSSSSPAINKGRSISDFFITFDILRNHRQFGANVDIGAYEYLK